VLEKLSWFDLAAGPRPGESLLSGYMPPWLRTALGEVPPDVCGFFLGEIPAGWRKLLTARLRLRACPRTFVLRLRREGDGVTLSLRLNVDKAGAERTLADELEKWRRQGPHAWLARFPEMCLGLEAPALLGQPLRDMRWEADPRGGYVRTRVRIPGPTWRALGTLVKGAAGR
jgi:hypothetical protein